MTKKDRQREQLNNTSGRAHLGGTRFGQQPGDAKPKADKGDKARPNDGKTS